MYSAIVGGLIILQIVMIYTSLSFVGDLDDFKIRYHIVEVDKGSAERMPVQQYDSIDKIVNCSYTHCCHYLYHDAPLYYKADNATCSPNFVQAVNAEWKGMEQGVCWAMKLADIATQPFCMQSLRKYRLNLRAKFEDILTTWGSLIYLILGLQCLSFLFSLFMTFTRDIDYTDDMKEDHDN